MKGFINSFFSLNINPVELRLISRGVALSNERRIEFYELEKISLYVSLGIRGGSGRGRGRGKKPTARPLAQPDDDIYQPEVAGEDEVGGANDDDGDVVRANVGGVGVDGVGVDGVGVDGVGVDSVGVEGRESESSDEE